MIRGYLNKSLIWLVMIAFLNLSLFPSLYFFGDAYAADISVMIIPLPDPGRLEYGLMDDLATAFKDTGKFDVVSKKEVERYVKSKAGNIQIKDLNQIFRQAVTLLKKGQKLYNSLKTEKAIVSLKEAKLKFKESLPIILKSSDYSRYLGTYFYLAMAYQSKGINGAAKQELRDMVLIDPKRKKRKFSTKYYPPKTLKLYKEVRDGVLKGDNGKLSVKTKPSRAKIYFDGKYIGESPVEISKIPVGEHFLILKKEGYAEWSDSKFIIKGKNLIESDLKKASVGKGFIEARPVKSSFDIKRDVANTLDEMSVSLGGDVFLFYDFSFNGNKGSVSAQLYDQRNQEVSGVEEVKIPDRLNPQGAFSELALKLTSHLSREGYVLSNQPKPDEKPLGSDTQQQMLQPLVQTNQPDQPDLTGEVSDPYDWKTLPSKQPGMVKAWYEKWWVWAIIVGSIGVTAGGVFMFTDIGKSPASKSTIRVNR